MLEEKDRNYKIFCPYCKSYNILPYSEITTIKDKKRITCKFCKKDINVILNNK